MRILVVGPPGAGKGTQAAALGAELGVAHISTGDLFRAHVDGDTELGRQVKKYLQAGALVPDEITNAMVAQRLTDDDCRVGFLLDGFPRTVGQAEVLEDLLRDRDCVIDTVLAFDAPEDEVVQRLLTRGRGDDTEDVIRRRQQLYREQTAPLLDFYSDRLITVPAVGSIADVTARALTRCEPGRDERAMTGGGVRAVVRRLRGRTTIELKSPGEIEAMRAAGAVVARTLRLLEGYATAGMSTGDLDELAEQAIRDAGAVPSFKGYHGFPGSICSSVNEQVVHGIPSHKQVLAEGDLLSIDCGAILDGWHGDAAVTVHIGAAAESDSRLSAACQAALKAGIAAAQPGGRLTDISHAVESAALAAAATHGTSYGIVADYGGHGIGTAMHMDPFLPNVGRPGRGPRLLPGMTLAIEPMLTAGSDKTEELDDGWTVVTVDGSRAAHWEHSVAVTENGPLVLTVE